MVGAFNNNSKFVKIDLIFCLVASILGFIFFFLLFVAGVHWIKIIIVLIHAVVLLGQYFVGRGVLGDVNEAREEQLRTFN
jgi:hypothetical protein